MVYLKKIYPSITGVYTFYIHFSWNNYSFPLDLLNSFEKSIKYLKFSNCSNFTRNFIFQSKCSHFPDSRYLDPQLHHRLRADIQQHLHHPGAPRRDQSMQVRLRSKRMVSPESLDETLVELLEQQRGVNLKCQNSREFLLNQLTSWTVVRPTRKCW